MRNQPTITAIRPMTDAELNNEGWEGTPKWHIPYAVELSDGTIYYPSQDPEGNGPGAWFILDDQGEDLNIYDADVRVSLVGLHVGVVNLASRGEMALCGWQGEDPPAAIHLGPDGHPTLIPSQDDEGNGPGFVFGIDSDGDAIMLGATR